MVLSGGDGSQEQRGMLAQYTDMYRQLVNKNLLYVNVSFAGKSCGYVKIFVNENLFCFNVSFAGKGCEYVKILVSPAFPCKETHRDHIWSITILLYVYVSFAGK